MVRRLVGIPVSQIRVPGFKSKLCSQFQLPAAVHPESQQVMAQVGGSLLGLSTWLPALVPARSQYRHLEKQLVALSVCDSNKITSFSKKDIFFHLTCIKSKYKIILKSQRRKQVNGGSMNKYSLLWSALCLLSILLTFHLYLQTTFYLMHTSKINHAKLDALKLACKSYLIPPGQL